jgi:hypothetical protein
MKDSDQSVSRGVRPAPLIESDPRVVLNEPVSDDVGELTPEDLTYAAVLIERHQSRNGYKWNPLTEICIERRRLRFNRAAERLRQQRAGEQK